MSRIIRVGIYAIELNDGRCYVGSSTDVLNRWYQHRYLLRGGKHHSPHMQHAWTKYGEEAFTFRVLEDCAQESLIEREQHWISLLAPVFNYAPVAGSRKGAKFTDEQRAKLSAQRKGRKQSEAHRAARAKAMLGNKNGAGKTKTDEQRAVIAERMKGNQFWLGKKHTPEAIEKTRSKQKGVPRPYARGPRSEATIAKMREAAMANRENRRRAALTRWAKRP